MKLRYFTQCCFEKIIRNDQNNENNQKNLRGKKKNRNFWPVINSMQWLILNSHKNDYVLNEWQLLRWKQKRWSSSRSNWTKYKNLIISVQNESHTLLKRASRYWWKEAKLILLGVFLSATIKTINLKEQ